MKFEEMLKKTSQPVRFKKRIEKIKKRSLVKISWLRFFFFNLYKEKRLNSSTVEVSSSFEQKPNFTRQKGPCA